jgi:hypothetical protein
MIRFWDLPNESIALVLQNMDARDILRLSHTSNWFRRFSLQDVHWNRICPLGYNGIALYQFYFQFYEPLIFLKGYYQSDYPFYKGELISIDFHQTHYPITISKIQFPKHSIITKQPFSLQSQIIIDYTTTNVHSELLYGVGIDKQIVCTEELEHQVTLHLVENMDHLTLDLIPNGNPNPDTGLWGFQNQYGSNTTLTENNTKTVITFDCNKCKKVRVRTPTGVVDYIPKLSKRNRILT